MRDLAHNLGVEIVLAPGLIDDTYTSEPIDLLGFNSATIVIATNAFDSPEPVYVASLEESDTVESGDFDEVAADDLVGEFPEALEDTSVVKVGYIGTKRYLRLVVTETSGEIDITALVIKGHARSAPVV